MDFDIKRAFFWKAWQWLQKDPWGLIVVYVAILIATFLGIWAVIEPLGIPETIDIHALPDFVKKRFFFHAMLAFFIGSITTIILELVFRKNIWTSYGAKYNVHMQSEGWRGQGWMFDGEVAGRPGESKRIEAIKICLGHDFPPGMSVRYQAHVQDEGWQPWVCEGDYAGTTGLEKRMEAIKIELDNAPGYSIVYRAFVRADAEEGQWQPWVSDGEEAGTTGQAKRIEAIRILVLSPHRYGQFWKQTPCPWGHPQGRKWGLFSE